MTTFFSRFFAWPRRSRLLKFLLQFVAILCLLEFGIRGLSGISRAGNIAENVAAFVVFGLLLYYATPVFKVLVAAFLGLAFLFQAPHAVFYGSWVDPMNMYLFFQNIAEVADIAPDLERMGLAKVFVLITLAVASIAYLWHISRTHKGSAWVSALVVAIFAFQPIRDGVFKPEKIEKRFTKDSHGILRSFHNSSGVFLSMLLSETLGNAVYPPYSHVAYQKSAGASEGDPRLSPNIFIYFGESLSSKYMSVFGHEKGTTPFLEGVFDSGLYGIAKEAIAGALATMPSTVRFFHLLEEPDARTQAASFETSLFSYAQDSAYETTYVSTQAENYINHIFRLLAGKYCDNVLTPSEFDRSYEVRDYADDILVFDMLEQFQIEQPYLTVFQPNGSHVPFHQGSPKEFKKFGTDSALAECENSVYYTDHILHALTERIAAESDRPWVFVITSDHGTHVDAKRTTRSVEFEASYLVPAIVITNDEQIYETEIKPLEEYPYLFHQDLSKLVARLLGYDAPCRDSETGVLFGGLLSGFGGTKSVQISADGVIQVKPYSR